jgi:hypothetical protein
MWQVWHVEEELYIRDQAQPLSTAPQRVFRAYAGLVTAVGLDAAGECAVAGYANGHLGFFDLLAGTCVASVVRDPHLP